MKYWRSVASHSHTFLQYNILLFPLQYAVQAIHVKKVRCHLICMANAVCYKTGRIYGTKGRSKDVRSEKLVCVHRLHLLLVFH